MTKCNERRASSMPLDTVVFTMVLIDYVPRVRKVLSLALDEAERQGSAYVRTEHILLGIVRDGGGVAADILDTFGILGKVRAKVFELFG